MNARRAILQILNGRDVFRKIVLEPDTTISLGDEDWADVVVRPIVPQGARGLDLFWDGLALRIDGIGTSPWFYLNGRQVLTGELFHREFVQVAGVQLRLTLEGMSHPAPSLSAHARSVRDALLAAPRAYAIVDAARDRRILRRLEDAIDPHRSLYEGLEGRTLDNVAPYLVCLDPASPLCDVLLTEGWGNGWGIYVASSADPEQMRRHWRRYLMVDDAIDRRLYFRYYDPRALRDFWPTATDWQRAALLSGCDFIAMEASSGEPIFAKTTDDPPTYPPRPLYIYEDQMDELSQVHRRRFVDKVARFMREHFGDWVTPFDETALSTWIMKGLERAESYGVDTEPEAIQMILLWHLLGPEPEKRWPWAAEILQAPEFEPMGRVRALIDAARDADVKDIERAVLSMERFS